MTTMCKGRGSSGEVWSELLHDVTCAAEWDERRGDISMLRQRASIRTLGATVPACAGWDGDAVSVFGWRPDCRASESLRRRTLDGACDGSLVGRAKESDDIVNL